MKLASCILAFSQGISASSRPEDRSLAAQYLAALAPLLASVVLKKDVSAGIKDIDRLFGNSWIVDAAPFKEAFELWERSQRGQALHIAIDRMSPPRRLPAWPAN